MINNPTEDDLLKLVGKRVRIHFKPLERVIDGVFHGICHFLAPGVKFRGGTSFIDAIEAIEAIAESDDDRSANQI